jgi:hypothetical protein
MKYFEFLAKVIEDGVEAAKKDYTRPAQQCKLHGSLAGFEICKEKGMVELKAILKEAQEASFEMSFGGSPDMKVDAETYWFKKCYEAEIEWVCNVVSAMMLNHGVRPIVRPTARGVQKAAEILNGEVKYG